jgi:hypothetical protein
MPEEYTRLKGYNSYSDELLSSQIENNVLAFFQWGLLGIGAFTNVNRPQSGVFGGTWHTLRRVNDPAYSGGQVWEGIRKDWVWETGIGFTGVSPIQISGVYVSGTYYPTGHATFGHYVDYPLGRIVFNNTISSGAPVTLNYSYRNVQMYKEADAPWFNEIQYRSFRTDNDHIDRFASGDFSTLANHRVQLPAVVLEIVPQRNWKPYEMGKGGHWCLQDIKFHVVAENPSDRNKLVDIISAQDDTTIWMYNLNTILESGFYPLNHRGELISNPKMYPELVDNYRFKKLNFTDIVVSEVESLNIYLYRATIRATAEVLFGQV